MKSQKGFIPVIIILVILIGFVGVFYLKTLKTKNIIVNTTSLPMATSDPTINWKTYNDNQNRFSFKYPPIFNLESKLNQFFEPNYLIVDDTTRVNFMYRNEKLESDNFDLNYYNIREYEKDNLKIKSGTYINQYSGFPESIHVEGYIYDKNKYQMFKLYTTKDQREKWELIFDQILSTFKFTN